VSVKQAALAVFAALAAPGVAPRGPAPRGLPVAVETAGKEVVLLTGPATDLELWGVYPSTDGLPIWGRGPLDDRKAFATLAGEALASMTAISGSGTATSGGERRRPIHFGTVTDRFRGKVMRLYVLVASRPGFIHRSRLAWGGDHIPGVQLSGRMHGRDGGGGVAARMTAEVHLRVPGRAGVQVLFVGYDSDGRQIPPTGTRPFRQHVAGLGMTDR
jgi:hypothetical protein